MPQGASEVAAETYLRVLLMGPAKIGKTQCCVTTSPRGVYLINSDDKSSIRPAVRAWKRKDGGLGAVAGDEFDVDLVQDLNAMEKAITTARAGVKSGKYRTVIWDTISSFGTFIESDLADASDSGNGPDGRRYWPEYTKRLSNIVNRLFRLRAHVIVTSHYIEVGDGEPMEGQAPKKGQGILPMLGGKAKQVIPAMFQDVLFMEKKGPDRMFITGMEGVWGPGCRSMSGNRAIPANVRTLMKEFGIMPSNEGKKKLVVAKPAA